MIVTALASAVGLLAVALIVVARVWRDETTAVSVRIDALLPQTQCAQCTYPGCRPYADAIARREADINQCPPGGQATVDALAKLLNRESKLLNPEHGQHHTEPLVAIIREDLCIGCKLCINACPVDAIVGTAKAMHTVIASECTGCELCVEPCPVDCIDMLARPDSLLTWRRPLPQPRAVA